MGQQKKPSRAAGYIRRMIDDERSENQGKFLAQRHTRNTKETVQYKGKLEKQRDAVKGVKGNAFVVGSNENVNVKGRAVKSADKKKPK